jgi:predicted DNA-binding transcriptional regulator AlpA
MKLITRQEAAARASISLRHLERLIGNGQGPPLVRLGARRIAIVEADFEAWLSSRRQVPPGWEADAA